VTNIYLRSKVFYRTMFHTKVIWFQRDA